MAITTAGMSPQQAVLLTTLSKGDGLTSEELALRAKVPVTATSIGPVFEETVSHYPHSLRAMKLVEARTEQEEDTEGRWINVTRWYITEKGEQAAGKVKGRKIGPVVKVPPAELDPVVIAYKERVTYGLEQLTEADLKLIRASLGTKYHEVDAKRMGDLHNQILARRKQGAYSDPNDKRIKSLEKLLREFGPKGTVIEGFLTDEQYSDVTNMLRKMGALEDE